MRSMVGKPGLWALRSAMGATLIAALVGSGAAWGHSAMFPDGFKFNDRDEGPTAAELMRLRGQSQPGFVCTDGSAQGYPCSKVDLRAFVPKASLGGGTQNNHRRICGLDQIRNNIGVSARGVIGQARIICNQYFIGAIFLQFPGDAFYTGADDHGA